MHSHNQRSFCLSELTCGSLYFCLSAKEGGSFHLVSKVKPKTHHWHIKRYHCLCFKLHFVGCCGQRFRIPEVSKARLDGALARDTLGCGDAHDPGMVEGVPAWGRGWHWMAFGIPSKPNHTVILWFFDSLINNGWQQNVAWPPTMSEEGQAHGWPTQPCHPRNPALTGKHRSSLCQGIVFYAGKPSYMSEKACRRCE